MAIFKVRCFNEDAMPDGRPDRDVIAGSAQEAAERICGEQLMHGGRQFGRLRAHVWRPTAPALRHMFFVPVAPPHRLD